jgi:hypothetical protein
LGSAGYANWTPLSRTKSFQGKLDGGGFTISGLATDTTADYAGLFGRVAGNAEIKNLRLEISQITLRGTQSYTGGLAGLIEGSTVISNVHVSGNVAGYKRVGGFAGQIKGDSLVTDCSFTGVVGFSSTGGEATGGFVGHMSGGTIEGCRVYGTTVDGSTQVGGFVGLMEGGEITHSVVSGVSYISAENSRVGGFAGSVKGNAGIACSAVREAVAVESRTNSGVQSGGFVGYLQGNTEITSCYTFADVTGKRGSLEEVGGFVGEVESSNASISACYAAGTITTDETERDFIGPFAGRHNNNPAVFSQCYYDSDKLGAWHNAASDVSVPLSTEDIQDPAKLAGFDFAGRWIGVPGDYPKLRGVDESLLFGAGSGTEDAPYLIETARELDSIRCILSGAGAYFRLGADIDLESYLEESYGTKGWLPIGTAETPFVGGLDGGGHTISGLTIDRPDMDGVGLFGYVEYAALKDISVVLGQDGIIGRAYAGGLIGYGRETLVLNCSVTGAGEVFGSSRVGGFAGEIEFLDVSGCRAAVNVTGGDYAGGFAGYMDDADVANSSALGTVTGEKSVGGFVGYIADGHVTASYSIGNVTGNNSVGGFSGYIGDADVVNSYTIGNVAGSEPVGGFVGDNDLDAYVSRCYAIGQVIGTGEDVGGFAGQHYYSDGALIWYCYYDEILSGQAGAIGNAPQDETWEYYQDYLRNTVAAGLPTADMLTGGAYDNWNFSSSEWRIAEGASYPYLSWQALPADGPEALSYTYGGGEYALADLSAGITVTGDSAAFEIDENALAAHLAGLIPAQTLLRVVVPDLTEAGVPYTVYILTTQTGGGVTVTPVTVTRTASPAGGGGSGSPADDEAFPFTDVLKSDWFYNDVAYVYDNGLFEGTGAATFSPRLPMTRAMLVTVLFRLDAPAKGANTTGFADVPLGQWYSDAIAWAAQNGIVEGYDATHFGPADSVTREQLAAILHRYMRYAGLDRPVTEQHIIFTDEAQISDYAKDPIQTLYKLSVIQGLGGGVIDPKTDATRAEVAAMLHRFMENLIG